mgnify:FL=1
MNVIFSKEQGADLVAGIMTQTDRLCEPQPVFVIIPGAGEYWAWNPTVLRIFHQPGDASLLSLPGIAKHAPALPGDSFLAREPWFHVRTEPNGNAVIRYGGGEERIVTPVGKFRVRWPGSWNSGRQMYRWMARSRLHVTAVQLVREDVEALWYWRIDFRRSEP